jgi:hypothetical protein
MAPLAPSFGIVHGRNGGTYAYAHEIVECLMEVVGLREYNLFIVQALTCSYSQAAPCLIGQGLLDNGNLTQYHFFMGLLSSPNWLGRTEPFDQDISG